MSSTQEKVKHLTVADVAERLAVEPWVIYSLAREGQLKALRIGRRIRFRLEDIEAYEAAHVGEGR